KRAYCLKIQPATGSFARNLIYSTKPGVGELLLEYQRKVFAPRYPVIVTFVNVLNPRSYAFHTRNQFEDVGFFNFNGNKYHMMALPTS
ncbi:hypothetical protein POV14_15580, partial [Klebsiella variicola]